MKCVIQTGGKQYIVEKGDIIDVETMKVEKGSHIELDILMTIDEKDNIEVGNPLVSKKLHAEVVDHFRGEKLRIFKYKRRKRYRKSQGHRQNLMKIKVLGLK